MTEKEIEDICQRLDTTAYCTAMMISFLLSVAIIAAAIIIKG